MKRSFALYVEINQLPHEHAAAIHKFLTEVTHSFGNQLSHSIEKQPPDEDQSFEAFPDCLDNFEFDDPPF